MSIRDYIYEASLGTDENDLVKEILFEEDGYSPFPRGVKVTNVKKEFISLLQPGDILNTRRVRMGAGIFGRAFIKVSQLIQDSFFTHSSMYIGGEKVIHAERDGVQIAPLRRVMDQGEVIILRPRASEGEKQNAVRYMKTSIGKPYSMNHALLAGAREIWKLMKGEDTLRKGKVKRDFKRKATEEEYNIICSNLIAMSYPNINFSSLTPRKYVMPATFTRSRMTKKIAVWTPPGSDYDRKE